MRFTKMHGAGNDYVVLDARGLEHDWPDLARRLCDRHLGVGADGLLLVTPSSEADIRMRMFNPDGSEAEMCGNGIRCFAKYVVERGIVSSGENGLRVETGDGVMVVTPLTTDGQSTRSRVAMGTPRLRAAEVPIDLARASRPGIDATALAPERIEVNKTVLDRLGLSVDELAVSVQVPIEDRIFHITGVSMGNPHAVAFIDDPVDGVPLERFGPRMEHHPLFPNRVNFHVVNVLGRTRLRARTWERGAGITLACGTGACAIAVASLLHGHTGEMVDVELPGGTLSIIWPGVGPVYLEGPAEEVFEGEWKG